MNFSAPIEHYAASQPERTAVVAGEASLDYAELARRVRSAAARLLELGVRPGDRVGLCLRDDADHLVALLAVARIGAVILPLDWRARPQELEGLARRFGAARVLVHPGAAPLASTPTAVLDEEWYRGGEARLADAACPQDPALPLLLSLTSGSTGTPKGVLVTHGQLFARFVATWGDLRRRRGERFLSTFSLAYSFGRNFCLYSLAGGNTVILAPPLMAAEELVEALGRSEATSGIFAPALFRKLLELEGSASPLLPRLELMISGTAALHPEEKREVVRRINPNLYETYGTSSAGNVAILAAADVPAHAESVGRQSFLTELQIVDERDRPVPRGTPGLVRCRGPQVAQGFWEDPDASPGAEAFRDGWCYTGERARLDADGYLYLEGRVSDMIVRGGFNVYPAEVERVLAAHPAVADASVAAVASEELGEDLVAFVVLRPDAALPDLIGHCRSELVAHKVPSRVYALDELPRSAAGKVTRAALVARLEAGGLRCVGRSEAPAAEPEPAAPGRAPGPVEPAGTGRAVETGALAEQLARIAARLLGRARVEPDRGFFELGGDSLLVLSLRRELESLTGRRVPSAAIFRAPTLAALAQSLCSEGAGPTAAVLALESRGARPPFFFLSGHRTHFGDHLGADQPAYRVLYQDLDRPEPLTRVEDMAAYALASLRLVQPRGPWLLGGHGLGAKVAFEIARQLEAAGEAPALLALCESWVQGARRPTPGTSRARRIWLRLRDRARRLREVGVARALSEALADSARKLRRATWRRRRRLPSRGRARLRAASQRALRDYAPGRYGGRVTLLRSASCPPWILRDPLDGWGPLAGGGVEVHELPGTHTSLYAEPHVRVLARVLGDALGRAQARLGTAARGDASRPEP